MARFASLSDRVAGLGGAKWAVHLEGKRREREGASLIFLSIGEPDLPPPARVVEQAVASLRGGRTRYAGGQGEAVALDAIARHLTARSGGLAVGPEQIVCFAGTQNALYSVIAMLAEAGDEVLVPDPYYATYEAVVAASGAAFVPVPTRPEDGFHLTADALAAQVTPRSHVLLLNTPSNPTGGVLSAREIDEIGEVCIEHDLWIVCDEVYADLTFGRPFASPFDRPQLRARSFSVASISKSHALPGFRTGWAACPPGVAPRLVTVAETMLFGSQPFLADALAVALGEQHDEVAALRDTFEARARVLVDAFAVERGSDGEQLCDRERDGDRDGDSDGERGAGAATAGDGAATAGDGACVGAATARMPEGGMFGMVDVRATGLSGEAFAWRLLDEMGVVVMPGESFGAGGAGHVRVALTVEAEVLADACARIRSLADRLARPAAR